MQQVATLDDELTLVAGVDVRQQQRLRGSGAKGLCIDTRSGA